MEEAHETLRIDGRQAQARDHPDRRHLGARRLRGDRPGHGRRPDHGLDRGDGRRRRPVAARGDRPDRQRPLLRRRRPRARCPRSSPRRPSPPASRPSTSSRFRPTVVRPTQVLSEIRLDEAPFLLGYVVTRPKPTAEVILATESGDPLLAWWRYGLGMTRRLHLRRQGAVGRGMDLAGPSSASSGPRSPATPCARPRPRGLLFRSSAKGRKAVVVARRDRAVGQVPQPGGDRADAGRSRARRPRRSRWPRSRRGATRPSST